MNNKKVVKNVNKYLLPLFAKYSQIYHKKNTIKNNIITYK